MWGSGREVGERWVVGVTVSEDGGVGRGRGMVGGCCWFLEPITSPSDPSASCWQHESWNVCWRCGRRQSWTFEGSTYLTGYSYRICG